MDRRRVNSGAVLGAPQSPQALAVILEQAAVVFELMVSYSEELLERQNQDGGWSYNKGGSSWTEPTCFALLALATGEVSASGAPGATGAARLGIAWLSARQRADGGWAPRDGVDQSTWVTAMTLMLPSELGPCGDNQRASRWLVEQTGRQSGFAYRLRLWLQGFGADPSDRFDGWPWFPDTAAWTAPTALTVLALQKFNRSVHDAEVEKRVSDGRSFLLMRRCRDGGWNHGSTHSLGYDSDSYPETTGLALLALQGTQQSQLGNALELAERHLRESRSLEATSWLTLGLLAHGRSPSPVPVIEHKGTIALSVAALAEAARQGRNPFVS